MIIQVIGLPGSGKTTYATELADIINAIHLNADDVRADLSKDLGFSEEDRTEQARRLGALSRLLANKGYHIVVDFINPTHKTREAFGSPDRIVWMDRAPTRDFPDTVAMWEIPTKFDLRFDDAFEYKDAARASVVDFGLHNWRNPTTLMLGRYQPWHSGHEALKEKAHERTEQVLIGVRSTYGTSEKDPLTFEEVSKYIIQGTARPSIVMRLPNITNIVYGRDVGYKVEQVKLDDEIEAISATQKRKDLGI